MEKSMNYPALPTNDASSQMLPAPPSYEQATGSTTASPQNRPPHVTVTQPSYPRQAPYPAQYGGSHVPQPQHIYVSQQGVPPQVVQQAPVVIIHQQAVLPLGPDPTFITCPSCHIQKLTRIEYEPSGRTHLMALLLCVLGLWCCACLPYCAGSCMNTNHYCGNCNKFLGTYGGAI